MTTYVQDYTALIEGLTTRWNAVAPIGTASVITYSFMESVPGYDPYITGFRTMSASDRAAVKTAFQRWSEVSGITFVEVPDNDSTMNRIGFCYSSGEWAGIANYPSSNSGSYLDVCGNIYVNTKYETTIVEGDYSFEVVLHEIGHTLGLKHPFEGDVRLSSDVDSNLNTVMSYTHTSSMQTTPNRFDIGAIRYLYGSSTSGYAAAYGNGRVYITVTDSAGASVVGTTGSDSMAGGAGNDWLYGNGGGDVLVGGGGNDRLYASSGASTLIGGAGQDWCELTAPAWNSATCSVAEVETLVGGAGRDWVNLVEGGNSLILAAIETLVGGAGGDWINLGNRGNTMVLTAVETLVGGTGQDSITLGNRGNTLILAAIETLTGGSGGDWINLGNRGNTMTVSGIDTLVGGTGNDDIQLSGYTGNTLVLAAIETLRGGWVSERIQLGNRGNTMTVSSIDTLVGGTGIDDITVVVASAGFYSPMTIDGGLGADRITLTQQTGYDTIAFRSENDGSALGVTSGFDQVNNFYTGDRVAITSSLRSAIDRNGNGAFTIASRASGAVNASSDEVVSLTTSVSNLADDNFASFRAALGTVTTGGSACKLLVVASDGSNSGLYLVADNGDGSIASGEVSLLAKFNGATLSGYSIIPA